MGITVNDIKRIINIGGDVSAYAGLWHKTLNNPPVPSLPIIDRPKPLPEETALLKALGSSLEQTVTGWVNCEPPNLDGNAKLDVTLIGLPPRGANTGRFLSDVIDEVKPDVLALDVTPLWLSAHMLYAFSVPCAAGLTVPAQVMSKNMAQLYASESFYPGNTNETAIIKSWLNKIPLVPIGVPLLEAKYSESDFMTAYIEKGAGEKEMLRKDFLTAYKSCDEALKDITKFADGAAMARQTAAAMMKLPGGKLREDYIEECCYMGARLADVAMQFSRQGTKGRVLAVVELTHLSDMEDIAKLLKDGLIDEFYTEPKKDPAARFWVLAGATAAKVADPVTLTVPETTVTTKLFDAEFAGWMKSKDAELLPETAIDRLIPAIVERTRKHPEIDHGSSVRGTIALKEVLYGLAQMNGGLTRANILKAALIALPPRIKPKEKGRETGIITEIAREVLYDISPFPIGEEKLANADNIRWMSPEDIMKNLKDLKPLSEEEKKNLGLGEKNQPAIMNSPEMNDKVLKDLESKKLLKKGAQGQYSLTKKALEYMLNELEEKLKNGEITPADYAAEKSRLTEMLSRAQSKFKMSAKDMANTIMEIMDAQDKQWNSQVTFERMHIYYHIKDRSGQMDLPPEKRDYYGLKMLIDDLADQGILQSTEENADFTLTGDALDILLDYLLPGDPKGRGLEGALQFGKQIVNERRQETRKFTAGDVFRDISVRHTLKEISKQRKNLEHVKKGDFRVYLKERRKLQSDIVLCMDTSGSMGFQHKLMYARLAAAGLAKAAIDGGDRVGVVAFNNYGSSTSPMTDKDKEETINYIVKLSARGNTNIGDGIKCAVDMLTGSNSRNQKYIILVTDGEPTAISQNVYDQLKKMKEKDLTEESALLEAKKAVGKGIKISVIHIASEGEPSDVFIRNVARLGGGKVRRISSPNDLKAVMHKT
jgi:Mg-chelatase subunit ChlD